MSRAAELRAKGMDASEALSEAWAEAKGEDNPLMPYDEGELIIPNPKRRKASVTFSQVY